MYAPQCVLSILLDSRKGAGFMSKLVNITIKRAILVSLPIILVLFICPLLVIDKSNINEELTEEIAEFTPYTQGISSQYNVESFDENLDIKVTLGEEIKQLTLANYLVGVVAAEMPASFEEEALMAQAVAARTYTIYKLGREYSSNHPETAVCNDINCCKAYADEVELREKWGDEYDTYLDKIRQAVKSTDGVIITYENEPILAAFHSSSSGMTASSEEVWGNSLPYLVSVESPEGSESVPNYISTVEITQEEFKQIVLERFPAANLSVDASEWIVINSLTSSGRVDSVSIGGVDTTGSVIRDMFGLRSAAFTVGASNGRIIFTTAGYGHGVGMSQYGANSLAKEGAQYEEILAIYYPSTELLRLYLE